MKLLIADGKRLQLLKYPGSKGRVVNELLQLFPEHHTYIEPFGGSYAVLLQKKQSPIEVINDIDDGITALAYCYLFCPDELLESASRDLHVQNLWKLLKDKKDGDMLFKAVRKLYVVYHSWGAKADTFGYTINEARDQTICLDPDNVYKIFKRLKDVQIFNEDYQKFLNRFQKTKNGFIYLDPPYTVTEKGKHYETVFTDENHIGLADILKKFTSKKVKWLLSYDKCDLIEELYSDYQIEEFSINYSLAKNVRSINRELLISNYDYRVKTEIREINLLDFIPTEKASPKV